MRYLVIALLAILMTTGATCSTKTTPPSSVFIDPSLQVRCPALSTFETSTIDLGELMKALNGLQGQYTECAVRMDCLIEATKTQDGKPTSQTCKAIKLSSPSNLERTGG